MAVFGVHRKASVLAAVSALAAALALAPAAQATVRPDYQCPDTDVCFFSGTNYDGTPYPVPVANVAQGTLINLRKAGVVVPWGSVSNQSDQVVQIYNDQCRCNAFYLYSGNRESPGAPYTADGVMFIEFSGGTS